MEEFAISSLRFASDHPISIPQTEIIRIGGQDIRDNDNIDVERNNDIDVVQR